VEGHQRPRRYAQLEAAKTSPISVGVFTLQRELDDMGTKIVCSFCGHKLPSEATWCHRCWHGPYSVRSAVWSSRPCVEGASATRATYFSDARFNKNDILRPAKNGTLAADRYHAAAVHQEARRRDGPEGSAIQAGRTVSNQIRYAQGRTISRVSSTSGGEILNYAAHAGGEGYWLLDREDLVVDAQRYTNRYSYDASGRIAQQQVQYQNTAACNHPISITADYTWANEELSAVSIKGGYTGFPAEGAPVTEWGSVATCTTKARVKKS
jgi:hypothetical protein